MHQPVPPEDRHPRNAGSQPVQVLRLHADDRHMQGQLYIRTSSGRCAETAVSGIGREPHAPVQVDTCKRNQPPSGPSQSVAPNDEILPQPPEEGPLGNVQQNTIPGHHGPRNCRRDAGQPLQAAERRPGDDDPEVISTITNRNIAPTTTTTAGTGTTAPTPHRFLFPPGLCFFFCFFFFSFPFGLFVTACVFLKVECIEKICVYFHYHYVQVRILIQKQFLKGTPPPHSSFIYTSYPILLLLFCCYCSYCWCTTLHRNYSNRVLVDRCVARRCPVAVATAA